MELSALGISLEPLRYIWLIAFLLYLVVCVAVDIAYSSTMSKEEARRLHVFYKGSPVDKAMRYAERMDARRHVRVGLHYRAVHLSAVQGHCP